MFFADGVTVVLYNVMQAFRRMSVVTVGQCFMAILSFLTVCFGAIFIGIGYGLLTALVTKWTNNVRGMWNRCHFQSGFKAFVVNYKLSCIQRIFGLLEARQLIFNWSHTWHKQKHHGFELACGQKVFLNYTHLDLGWNGGFFQLPLLAIVIAVPFKYCPWFESYVKL